ncbi:uncharacterized protein TNCV_2099021 [Trichonephila clavipes]|nr:uncharacterized protein TNCV_2099021 [Trichonephila clavipes]
MRKTVKAELGSFLMWPGVKIREVIKTFYEKKEAVIIIVVITDGDRFNSCQVIYSQFGLAIHQNDHQARRRFVEWAQNEIAIVPDFHKRILFSDEAHFWLNGYVNKQTCRIWSEANPQMYVETPLHPEKLTVRFVEWVQNEIAVVPDFHKRILFSDEVHFWLNGYVNKQNCRIWSEANPQLYVETPLHPEKLTVWCALWAGGIIGLYFFKNDEGHNVTVNGDRYRAMITNFFISELNNHDVQELWFQQDGATCHTARATIDLLKDTFGDRLISRFGHVNWPPRSCDLTPLDYFLWGYVKSLVYADKPQTLDHLEENIRRVIADVRPQMLEKVIENWTSRLDYIRASRGSHIALKSYLKYGNKVNIPPLFWKSSDKSSLVFGTQFTKRDSPLKKQNSTSVREVSGLIHPVALQICIGVYNGNAVNAMVSVTSNPFSQSPNDGRCNQECPAICKISDKNTLRGMSADQANTLPLLLVDLYFLDTRYVHG